MKITTYAYFRKFIKSTSVMLRLKLPRVLKFTLAGIVSFAPQYHGERGMCVVMSLVGRWLVGHVHELWLNGAS